MNALVTVIFAIVFFGIMIDVGLFDPVIRTVIRMVDHDPARLVVGTAVLAAVVSLDGDGSTTFIVTVSALLPLYLKLGVSPVVLTVVAGLANGTMNILPWGGPTARAAAALKISPSEVFVPMIPSLIAGMFIVLAFAWHLGVLERKRIGSIVVRERVLAGVGGGPEPSGLGGGDAFEGAADNSGAISGEFARPKLLWFNAFVTITLLAVLTMDILPIPVLFMIAAAVALMVNFPQVAEQQAAITRHSSSIVSVVGMVLETPERCMVVKSDVEGIMQHFAFSWQMHGGEFDKVEDVANSSVTFNKALNGWLSNLSKEQRERAVDALFAVLEASGAGSISAMMAAGPKVIPEMLGTYVGLSVEDRRNLNQALGIMLQAALARNPKVRRR